MIPNSLTIVSASLTMEWLEHDKLVFDTGLELQLQAVGQFLPNRDDFHPHDQAALIWPSGLSAAMV